MTTRERLLAAWRCQPVDHIPLAFHFWPTPCHPQAVWDNERERLAFYRAREWDARVEINTLVSPLPEVRFDAAYETHGDQTVLRQTWHTPGGTVSERLRVTDDWPWVRDPATSVGIGGDFHTARYLEFPFKTEDDLAALSYLFPLHNPRDTDAIVRRHGEARALADAFEVPLLVYHSAGMDWLTWLFPPDKAIIGVLEQPAMMQRLLEIINAAHRERLRTVLELGVDGVLRRGWYESADLWNPAHFTTFARPALEADITLAHDAGAAFIYLMDSGIMPLLDQLAALPFDCLYGVDPATSAQPLDVIRTALPGKSLWGGISGPLHLGRGTPAEVEQAVESTTASCGSAGLIFGPGVGIRHDWPWENIMAYDRAWRRVRGSSG